MHDFDQRLLAAAIAASFVVGSDFHDRITDRASVSPEEHEKNRAQLTRIAGKTAVTHVFTVVKERGEVFITSLSATGEELASQPLDPFYARFQEATPLLIDSFDRGKNHYFEEYKTPYGPFYSLYLPRKTPKGKFYVIVADISLGIVDEKRREVLVSYCGKGVGIFLLSLCFMFPFLTVISGRLSRLNQFAREMISSKFNPDPKVLAEIGYFARAYQDEVGTISSSLLSLFEALKNHIRELKETVSQKNKIESELRIAREIQGGILPTVFPPDARCPTLEIHAALKPAREVGGDFYDYVLLDENNVFFSIGDVSGKGIPAAFFMAITATLLKTGSRRLFRPKETLELLNQDLAKDNPSSMFVTVLCGIINIRSGEVEYAVAGHNPPVVLKKGGAIFLAAGGTAVGVMENGPVFTGSFVLNPDETLFLYTDGAPEAVNSGGEFLGDEGFIALLNQARDASPGKIVPEILGKIEEFSAGVPLADDVALMAIRFLGSPTKEASEPEVRLILKNHRGSVETVHEAFSDIWKRRRLPEDAFADLMIMVEELVVNVASHGGMGPDEAGIEVRLWIGADNLLLEVEDGGPPFNPLDLPEPDLEAPLENREVGGLGVHLLKKLSDQVSYERANGRNLVRCRKNVVVLPGLT